MDKQGTIEIHITGTKGNNPLSPDNYDIKEIKMLLDNIEDLLYPNNKKDRPDITYDLQPGSVRNVFRTSLQATAAFVTIIDIVNQSGSIDDLVLPTARAIENIQSVSKKTDYTFELKTSYAPEKILTVSPKTNYYITANHWIDAELYFYGILTNAGGKDKSNIHIDTTDSGTIIIATDKDILKKEEKNLLYREFGVRVLGKQNIETGEIDKTNLKLVELIDYNPSYNETYINSLIAKVGDRFKGIDVDNWISEIRGGYEQ